MKTKLIPLIVLAGLTLCALPSAAQISVVNTGSLNDTVNQTSYTLSFDAGNGGTADKLIVSAGTESGSAAQITGITYNGVALTLILNTGGGGLSRNRGIWYLDNPFSGGAANIVVLGTATAFSHMRLGVASISGSSPGAAIANIAGAASVSLTVPVANSFVFAAHASNLISPATTADPPLTQIFGVTGDSANMAAGYQNSVAVGPASYSFTSTLDPQTSAAAFVPTNAAPVIVSTTPADNATNVAIGANLVATFSEPVVAGTGNVQLWLVGGGSPVESFDVTNSSQLTFTNQTLIINPTANLTPGFEYYVLIPAAAIVDTTGGDAFAGISDPTAWSFTADSTAPTLVSLNPADNSPAVSVSANLVVTFSESVFAGTGNVALWQVGGGSPLESFDVTSSLQLTFSGATLTINPTNNLTPGVEYYVLIATNAVVDTNNFAFAGISDPTVWSFTADSTAPTVVFLNPADDSPAVSVSANLVATFTEPVAAGTGNIELWTAGGGAPVESFDVTNSSQLTFSGATLTINPTADLESATNYYVIIPAAAVQDLSGNFFSGQTNATDWNFTTVAPPPVLTLLNTANFTDNVTKTGFTNWTYTTSFDPDDNADALVLMFASEGGGVSAVVSFGSQVMTRAVPFGSVNNPVGIYYLNNPSVTSQTVSVTISLSSNTNINGMGFTILALNNSDNNLGIVPTAAVTNDTTQTPLSIDINVPDSNSFVVAGYNNNASTGTTSVNSPLTSLHAGDFGGLVGAFGYDADVAAGNQTYGFTTAAATTNANSAAVAFAGVSTPTNTFANWISNPVFGLAVADQDLGDDPDGDRNPNGVENFFGTHPGVPSGGLVAGAVSGNTFNFTHPQNATPASDLTASYQWSKDLAGFLAGGATDGAGTTVTFTTQADTPSPGFTTVTATVTGTPTSKLFFRVGVTQN